MSYYIWKVKKDMRNVLKESTEYSTYFMCYTSEVDKIIISNNWIG